ncbi:PAP2 family protein [Acidipropionibacterium jensenii]|uniref:phosphatase PAP2 family protein n=1 Tax=Acidipropionibacterium jensenii TaxID=1749 RepID=UPI000BEF1AC2|nr:phosphatase PAP2 family protein [Acidipropionibacterium jensenii]AZZ42386.1 PAP2 family protein [Acidipropionibacterium jensenii]
MHDELLSDEQDPGASVRPRETDRRADMVICVICAVLVAGVIATGLAVRRSTAEMGVVVWVDTQHSPFLDGIAWALSWIFEAPRAAVVAAVLVLMVAWWRRSVISGLRAGLALALTWGSSYLMKLLVDRPRPQWSLLRHHLAGPEQDPSFPSGHVTFAAALVIVALLCTRRTYRAWIVIPGTALVLGVGASRLYLGVHYPSDIVAGMVYGAAAGYLMFRATIVVNRVHLALRGVRAGHVTHIESGDDE